MVYLLTQEKDYSLLNGLKIKQEGVSGVLHRCTVEQTVSSISSY